MSPRAEPSGRNEVIAVIGAPNGGDAAVIYRRARARKGPPRWIVPADLLEILRFSGAVGAGILLPQVWWPRYCCLVARLRLARHRRRSLAAFRESLTAILGRESAPQAQGLFEAKREQVHRRHLSVAGELVGRGRGLDISLVGADGLSLALESGRGAIVWVTDTYPRLILSKRALWEAGFQPYQVSRVEHGFGNSRLAMATINPLVRQAEDPYLAGRIVFEAGGETDVIRRILQRLGEGGLVLMTNNQYSGAMFIELPFGRAGFISLPTAPLNLAVRHRVPLFTLCVTETRPLAAWRVTISPDLATTEIAGARDRDVVQREMAVIAGRARDRMFATFTAAPEQFRPLGERGFGASRFPALRAGGTGDRV